MINSHSRRVEYDGWPCIIVEDFLQDSFVETCVSELDFSGFQMEADDRHRVLYKVLNSHLLTRFFLSREFRNFLRNSTGVEWKFDHTSWLQLREMNPETPGLPRHTDNQVDRKAVCLFYLNKDWMDEQGGEICLHRSSDEDEREGFVIRPKLNKLIFFEATSSAWHSVRPVRFGARHCVVSEWIRT